jgi:putative ABC transport system permease protein
VVQSSTIRATARGPQPTIFLPVDQDFARLPTTPNFRTQATLLIGTTGSARAVLPDVQRRMLAVEEGAAPPVLATLEAQLARTGLAGDRIALLLVSVSAAIGLALGIFGLYGAMSESGRRRRREFAVRVALGASRVQLVRQVMNDGVRLAAAGLLIGLLLAIPVQRWVGAVTRDAGLPAWMWMATPGLLLLAVLVASVLPARRAIAANPLAIMRDE